MPRILFLIAGAILALLDSPAVAGPVEPPSRIVGLGDLDLSAEAGRIRLDRRIVAAVRVVCGQAWPLDPDAVAEVRRCRSETFARVAADRRIGHVYYVTEIALR
jgi:UrcA family protein